MRPLIVGLGLQTPLGTGLDATWRSLTMGRFIADHARVPMNPSPGTSRIEAIATAAALESIADAGIEVDSLQGSDTALVVGTSKGPIEQWLTPEVTAGAGREESAPRTAPWMRTIAAVRAPQAGPLNERTPRLSSSDFLRYSDTAACGVADRLSSSVENLGVPASLICDAASGCIGETQRNSRSVCAGPTGLADLADQISRNLGVSGPRLTLSAACASGLHALIRGVLLIRSGEMKRVLVVAAESSLHALFVANFQRLGVLPPPGFGCRPFDRDRKGFVMSEAAAAVVLGAPDSRPPATSGRRSIAVERFAFAGDATHLTGNDSQSRTLRHILARVIDGRPIDLAHAHGTGTPINDSAEMSALEATLPRGAPRPMLYSHKGALGHSLGASGLVSIVLNCLSHQTGIIPGNVQTPHPMESPSVEIRQQPTERKVERSLAVAAGFGGAMAAVTLRSLVTGADRGVAVYDSLNAVTEAVPTPASKSR